MLLTVNEIGQSQMFSHPTNRHFLSSSVIFEAYIASHTTLNLCMDALRCDIQLLVARFNNSGAILLHIRPPENLPLSSL